MMLFYKGFWIKSMSPVISARHARLLNSHLVCFSSKIGYPPPRADDDSKFKSFDEVCGTNTEEVYRPSYIENLDEPLKQLFTKERVIDVIKCLTC